MRRIYFASLLVVLILLIVLCWRVGGQIYRNRKLIDDFSYNSNMEQYQQGIPMDKMDLTNYSNYFAIPIAAQSKKVNQELVLDCDISYYTVQEGQKKLALQLVKGTRVLWLPTDELYNLYVGYGLRGYPTYEKGWRYVKPFMISSQPSELEQLPYYFVKTADLETVTRQVFKDDASLLNSLQNRMLSIEDVTFLYPRFIDKLFYDNGVFCSPDLQRPIWERIDWILMGMLIVFVLMSWIFRHRQILSMRQSNK